MEYVGISGTPGMGMVLRGFGDPAEENFGILGITGKGPCQRGQSWKFQG